MRTAVILFLLFLSSIPLSYAEILEAVANNGQLGSGDFSGKDNVDDVIITSVGLSDSRGIPLVSDLDNDGEPEIIILDSDTLKIFHFIANEWIFIGSYDVGTAEKYSNVIVSDIDADGYNEILFAGEESETLYVVEYNGSTVNPSTFSLASLSHTAGGTPGQMMIQCRDYEDCIIIYNQDDDGSTGVQPYLYASTFNATSVSGPQLTIESTLSGVSQNWCFPNIRHIEVQDVDDVGDVEYLFTAAHIFGSGFSGDQVSVYALDVNGTSLSVAFEEDAGFTVSDVYDVSGSVVCRDYMHLISSPLSFNFESGLPSNEILYALTVDPDQFKLVMHKNDGTFIDDYPELSEGNGILISNPMKADAFSDEIGTSVCVAGYDSNAGTVDIVCGREGGLVESRTFQNSYGGLGLIDPFNVTQSFNEYNAHGWAVQMDDTLYDGFDPHEILTAYGVFDLGSNIGSCTIPPCSLSVSFENPVGDSVCIAEDINQIGSDDIVCMTNTGAFYVDDKLQNAPATITNYNFNPCPANDVIKVNTTMKVTVTVTDGSQGTIPYDTVTSRVTSYFSTGDAVIDSIGNVTSGSPQTHFMLLNKTGNNLKMLLEGFDGGVPSSIDTIIQTYSVGQNGLSVDDSQCSFSTIAQSAINGSSGVAFDGTSKSDNAITNSATQVGELLGLGAGITWLIAIIVTVAGLFVYGVIGGNVAMGSGLAVIIGSMMVLLGSLLGLISFGIVIIISVISVAIITIWVSSRVFSGNV